MVHYTRLHDLDAAKQAYQFGRDSFRKDAVKGTTTRNPYLAGSLFHRAFEDGRRSEQASADALVPALPQAAGE
jgi:hypothetical protein